MRGSRILAVAPLGLLLASAQGDPATADRARIDAAKRQQAAALERSRALDARADELLDAAAAARTRQEAVAARVAAAQADITAAQARVALVARRLAFARRRLADAQLPSARLVAALQSLARRPAIAMVAQPGSVGDLVHVRAALHSVVPAVVDRSRRLAARVDTTTALEQEALAAARHLVDGRAALERERLALVEAEAASRLESSQLARTALVESDRAIALGEQARAIVDQLEIADAAADTRAALERLSGPLPRPGGAGATGSVGSAAYRLPASGRIVAGLGEVSDSGVRSRGLTLATDGGARVVAPAAGRVVFARPFRSYGTVVILAHPDGWTTLISGLEGTTVARGGMVEQGATIGRAPLGEDPRISVELRRRGVPIDLVALLG